jgi:hypothetical protein
LTPSQQAAREFWRQAGADGMPPFYIMSQYYAQLHANRDNLPAVTAALTQLLTGLAYATDVDTVLSEFTAGQDEELGYWAGRYSLFDSAGHRFDLVVGRDGATLTVPPALVDMQALPDHTDLATVTVLNSTGFSQGVLSLTNAQCQASLHFTLPVSDTSFDTTEPAALFEATAPRCQGTVTVGSGANADTHSVTGKRGAWTQAGVAQAADGDPAAAWYGQYVLLDVTDVTAVVQVADPVFIYDDPTYGLTFQWGASRYGSNVTYSNNVLRCADQDDDTTQYMMQFVAPQAEAAELNLAVSRAGVGRAYKGYWVASAPPPSLGAPTLRAQRPRPAGLRLGALDASDAANGGASQAIDVHSLTVDSTTKLTLPDGAVGNDYALTLQLTNCAATDTFTWTVPPTGDSPAATGRATITPSGGTNQTVLFTLDTLHNSDVGQHVLVPVQLKNTSATPQVTYTLQFDIVVGQFEALSLTPPVLMPVVVGTAFTQALEAHGANGLFTWAVDTSALPHGLKWNADSHQLTGTVTDASQVSKAFHLVVTLTAPDVLIDPLTVSLGITVQSAPAVASAMPLWERILILSAGASGMALALIAVLAIDRYRQAKATARTAETVATGNTNVENVTNGNPQAVAQRIIRREDSWNDALERTVTAAYQRLFELRDSVRNYQDKASDMEKLYSQILDYLENHKEDPADSPIDYGEYPLLEKAGYKTRFDVEKGSPAVEMSRNAFKRQLDRVTQEYQAQEGSWAVNKSFVNAMRESREQRNRLLESESE